MTADGHKAQRTRFAKDLGRYWLRDDGPRKSRTGKRPVSDRGRAAWLSFVLDRLADVPRPWR